MTTGAPATLESLLDGVIDYAGLYPPASLDMNDMVRCFAEGLESTSSWLIGRIIVPVDRLDEFEQASADLLPGASTEDPWCLSVLVSPAGSDSLVSDIERLSEFNQRHCQPGNGLALADVIELKAGSTKAIDQALDVLPDDVFPFFELPATTDARGLLAALAGSEAGAKIRTGGVTPELNPPTEAVAEFIHQCVMAGVPFKATAGLHHPLPNDEPAIPAHQQGFLNVFAAASVVHQHRISAEEVVSLLDLTDGIDFQDDRLQIGGHELTRDQVEDTRASLAIAFGSCSWNDPVSDLQALGLLPRTDPVGSS